MADLKTLKRRIGSVKKTQKITKAMKMVAASKLKKAREAAESARLYSEKLQKIVNDQIGITREESSARSIICGVKEPKKSLIILASSDRGLCGGLNTHLAKLALKTLKENPTAEVFFLGKKGYEYLRHHSEIKINGYSEGFKKLTYQIVKEFAESLIEKFNLAEIDSCQLIFPKFKTAISQEAKLIQLFPFQNSTEEKQETEYEYEPDQAELLEQIVPKAIAMNLFQSLLEAFASEQGARMTAMDNAVNNCADLIKKLNLRYNRTRQAKITTELIEIISAAESI